MNAFAALAEPRRQEIVSLLAEQGEMTASDIVKRFKVSAPAISQHLKVLREHSLVEVKKDAQRRLYSINPKGLNEMTDYLDGVRRMWEARLDRLEEYLNDLQSKE
ncbi:ArsR/SmtB family transcription factor [Pseudobacteriovorax antillogorgiicola]|uniref:Transcriptional regulator, ArsR family n=1 Tax=Pseudobacteriovorax antillogorgiicola TaxID=1513793 RepID=A0A1Y6BN57_9BACT|nr:metalloregulator ArsR/SmtB family transcription factor [Pseudobacteriovorax antillogorgiicola]TCS55459.1 ArsR family transcriptional regulator [Pseudobacteriovorax antillogorgiicola]SMF12203.1 transcriptional regulator, ArsR family [Pseudobacteriovorax antillogorgiicola]